MLLEEKLGFHLIVFVLLFGVLTLYSVLAILFRFWVLLLVFNVLVEYFSVIFFFSLLVDVIWFLEVCAFSISGNLLLEVKNFPSLNGVILRTEGCLTNLCSCTPLFIVLLWLLWLSFVSISV